VSLITDLRRWRFQLAKLPLQETIFDPLSLQAGVLPSAVIPPRRRPVRVTQLRVYGNRPFNIFIFCAIIARDISGFMARTHAISLWLGPRQCPLCGSEDVLRSHRRGVLEWSILLLLFMRPVRCRQCSARHVTFFFRRRRSNHGTSTVAETAED